MIATLAEPALHAIRKIYKTRMVISYLMLFNFPEIMHNRWNYYLHNSEKMIPPLWKRH